MMWEEAFAEVVEAREIVFSCPIAAIESRRVRVNGALQQRWVVMRPDIVVVVPVLSDGRWLVARQFRSGSESFEWRFPTGSVERGETPLAAAQRELMEETGLSAGKMVEVQDTMRPSGWISQRCVVFCATDIEGSFKASDVAEPLALFAKTRQEIVDLIHAHAFDQIVSRALLALVKA